METNGTNTFRDWDANPRATSELESETTYRDDRAAASLTVAFAAVWRTKCSVVSADMNAACDCCSSTILGVAAVVPVEG